MSSTSFKAGDIVSVSFPFSDLQTHKRRPGLVLVCGDIDLLIARLTTRPARELSDVPLKRWPDDSNALAEAWQRLTIAIVAELRKK